ncbi:hypothetical protein HNR46_001976 [Haloferula luteola]|uniref:Uncharacterized protein n=1 Tax=Haloferula luteola TaxID=595692 RepID=A0A840V047_9BACT|nr:hypothetical protein [Haloferula luteola]
MSLKIQAKIEFCLTRGGDVHSPFGRFCQYGDRMPIKVTKYAKTESLGYRKSAYPASEYADMASFAADDFSARWVDADAFPPHGHRSHGSCDAFSLVNGKHRHFPCAGTAQGRVIGWQAHFCTLGRGTRRIGACSPASRVFSRVPRTIHCHLSSLLRVRAAAVPSECHGLDPLDVRVVRSLPPGGFPGHPSFSSSPHPPRRFPLSLPQSPPGKRNPPVGDNNRLPPNQTPTNT